MYRFFARTVKSIGRLAGVLAIFGCFCCTTHAQTKKAPPPKISATPPKKPAKLGPGPKPTKNPGESPTSTSDHDRPTTEHPTKPNSPPDRPPAKPSGISEKPQAPNRSARPTTPVGTTESHTPNGTIQRRPGGGVRDVHDTSRNMDIHNGLNGSRRVSVERADHSRIVAERGGRGYVQHPYTYHGHEYGRRTYYDHGRRYDRYYARYGYRGGYLDVYAPGVYYALAFYGWAYNPWAVSVVYPWGWVGNPWYGYYGGYFTPYAVYSSASFWLTDYLIATSLRAAYAAEAAQTAAQDANATPLTPEVKKMIADEVQRQVALENSEAQQTAQGQDIDFGSSGVARMLSDNQPHVFVVGSDLDLVASSGQECAVSLGDVIEVPSAPPDNATGAAAIVLTSKGGKECGKTTQVTVAFNDLQDMQNHMRATIDKGLGELQSKQGKDGLPSAPPSAQVAPVQSSFAAIAPPPDPNAADEIKAQMQEADRSEQEVVGAVKPGAAGDTAPSPTQTAPASISLGQTVAQVSAVLGQPRSVGDLGGKKIYIYADMKVIFKDGKVIDIE